VIILRQPTISLQTFDFTKFCNQLLTQLFQQDMYMSFYTDPLYILQHTATQCFCKYIFCQPDHFL
jgi:hypothetical protein